MLLCDVVLLNDLGVAEILLVPILSGSCMLFF